MNSRFFPALRLVAVATLMGVTPGMASSQINKPMTWNIAAGLSIPNGSFGTVYDNGYHLAGGVNFQQRSSPIGFRIEGMFNQFKVTQSNPTLNANILSLTANVVVSSPTVLGPYLIGGLGIYSRTEPDGFGGNYPTDTSLGLNLGGGFRFALSGLDAYAEARWHQDGDENTRFIPISFGVIF